MSDAPTERFDAPPPAPEETKSPEEKNRKSRLPLILGIIGGVLLAAVIVLLILLLGRNGTPEAAGTDTPTPSTTPSATPTSAPSTPPAPTPTATVAPPVNTNVTITSYSISPAKIDCGPDAPADATDMQISWRSVNGTAAYFGVNAQGDAQANGMGWTLPPNGTQHDFPDGYDPYQYQCGNASQTYTITIVGPSGKVSKTVTVSRK